jgi:hypothetical protein
MTYVVQNRRTKKFLATSVNFYWWERTARKADRYPPDALEAAKEQARRHEAQLIALKDGE